jgi:hypothetical protein
VQGELIGNFFGTASIPIGPIFHRAIRVSPPSLQRRKAQRKEINMGQENPRYQVKLVYHAKIGEMISVTSEILGLEKVQKFISDRILNDMHQCSEIRHIQIDRLNPSYGEATKQTIMKPN